MSLIPEVPATPDAPNIDKNMPGQIIKFIQGRYPSDGITHGNFPGPLLQCRCYTRRGQVAFSNRFAWHKFTIVHNQDRREGSNTNRPSQSRRISRQMALDRHISENEPVTSAGRFWFERLFILRA